jgi:hypothetical protein
MRGVDELIIKPDGECVEMDVFMRGMESRMISGHDLLMDISDQCRGYSYKERHTHSSEGQGEA